MKFLITGTNGFLGQEICNSLLNDKYNLISTNRHTLDVSSEAQVNSYFKQNKIDIVIHTAIKGGRRNYKDTLSDFANNIKMFNNLLNNSDKFKLMFNFGSGAEFNRTNGVSDAREEDIHDFLPPDFYGLAKNLITREIIKHDFNIINLRLFGCFGTFEKEDRFIKNSIRSLLEKDPIVIHKNKKMDFVSAEDVCRVIEYYVENFSQKRLPIDLNLCYSQKNTLKDISDKICSLMNVENNAIIREDGLATEYTGCAKKLKQIDVEMDGLEAGLQRMIKSIEKNR